MCSGCFGEYEEGENFGWHLREKRAPGREAANDARSSPNQNCATDRSDDFEILVGCDTIVEIRRIYDRRVGAGEIAPNARADVPALRSRAFRKGQQSSAASAKDYRTWAERHHGRGIRSESAGFWLRVAGISLVLLTALALWLLAA